MILHIMLTHLRFVKCVQRQVSFIMSDSSPGNSGSLLSQIGRRYTYHVCFGAKKQLGKVSAYNRLTASPLHASKQGHPMVRCTICSNTVGTSHYIADFEDFIQDISDENPDTKCELAISDSMSDSVPKPIPRKSKWVHCSSQTGETVSSQSAIPSQHQLAFGCKNYNPSPGNPPLDLPHRRKRL